MKVISLIKGIVLFIGMVVIAAFVLVLGIPWWGNPKLNRFFTQAFSFFVCTVLGIKLQKIGFEKLQKRIPAVLIGNHQSALDFALIGTTCTEHTVIIAKKEMAHVPVLGWLFKASGNVMIDRSDPKSAHEEMNKIAQHLVDHDYTVSIFPEGTRNKHSNAVMLPFKKGAFHIAFAKGLPIIPVVCSSLQGIAVWEKLELGGGRVMIKVLDPVETKNVPLAEMNALIDKVHALMQAELNALNTQISLGAQVKT